MTPLQKAAFEMHRRLADTGLCNEAIIPQVLDEFPDLDENDYKAIGKAFIEHAAELERFRRERRH